jgi:cytochrome P450 family 110
MVQYRLPHGPRFSVYHSWHFIYRPKRYYAWLRRHGEIVTLATPLGTLIVVLTAEGARQVFTQDHEIYDAFQKEAFTSLTGLGSLWVLDGTYHRHERQLLSPQFSAHHCRGYGRAIQKITCRYADAWQTGQRINAYEAMLDLSLDVILRVTFGAERGGLIDEGRRALKKLLRAAHPLICFLPAFQAWWSPPWIRYQRAKQEFSRFVARYLAERRCGNEEHGDLLELMRSARRQDGSSMSDDAIRDELITIMLAGHETTAVALPARIPGRSSSGVWRSDAGAASRSRMSSGFSWPLVTRMEARCTMTTSAPSLVPF